MITVKHIGISFGVIIACWMGASAYTYFFDVTEPQLHITGIEQDGNYAGDIACAVSCSKSGEISLWLDGQPLAQKFKIKPREQGHPLQIPTKTLANGRHALKAEVTDTTYHHNKANFTCEFNIDNVPLHAALVKTDTEFKVFQGRTLHIQFQTNKPVQTAVVDALSTVYPCVPESKNAQIYEAFIPISVEEKPNEYLFSIDIVDKVGNKTRIDNKFQVVMYPFKKTVLQLDSNTIERANHEGLNERAFEDKIAELTKNSPREKLWQGVFCTPIDIQRITCDFGTIRTTQHKGRYAHKALDVINQPKSVIWAPQDGVVVLKEQFAASGNTIIIDHGMGVLSMFFHLDNFANINVGDKIAKGNPFGTIGKTGYAKGYHLHWEMRVNNIAIDPLQWTKPTF